MAQNLEIDVDAVSRLLPYVEQLTSDIQAAISDATPVDPDAAPSLAAAQTLTSKTIPDVHEVVSGRLTVVTDMIEEARKGFISTDEAFAELINEAPSLLRKPSDA